MELEKKFDEEGDMLTKMVKYYNKKVRGDLPDHKRGDKAWSDARREMITAERFSEVSGRIDPAGNPTRTPLSNLVMRYLHKPTNLDQVQRQSRRTHLGDRYKTHLEGTSEDTKIKITYPGIRKIPYYDMLGAAPHAMATVSKNGASYRYVAIFKDCKSLKSTPLDRAITNGNRKVPLRLNDETKQCYVPNDHNCWYETEGLMRAYPDAAGCHYVVFGKKTDDVLHVPIPIPNPPEPNPYKHVTDEVLKNLQDYYLGAILPELALSRQDEGLDLRAKSLSKDEIEKLKQQLSDPVDERLQGNET